MMGSWRPSWDGPPLPEQWPWVEGPFLQALCSCDQEGQGFWSSHRCSLPASSPLPPRIWPFLQRTHPPAHPARLQARFAPLLHLSQQPAPSPENLHFPTQQRSVLHWTRESTTALLGKRRRGSRPRQQNPLMFAKTTETSMFCTQTSPRTNIPQQLSFARACMRLQGPQRAPLPLALALQPAGFPQLPPNPSVLCLFNPGSCSLKLEEAALLCFAPAPWEQEPGALCASPGKTPHPRTLLLDLQAGLSSVVGLGSEKHSPVPRRMRWLCPGVHIPRRLAPLFSLPAAFSSSSRTKHSTGNKKVPPAKEQSGISGDSHFPGGI